MSDPAKIHPATVADLLAIPEDRRRHEIVDGVLFEKEAASGPHGREYGVALQSRTNVSIGTAVRRFRLRLAREANNGLSQSSIRALVGA